MTRRLVTPLRTLAFALFAGSALAAAPAARAGGYDDRGYGRGCGESDAECRYEYVVVYETRRVPRVVWKTVYDDCGEPRRVKGVIYKTVRVPVEKRVRVCEEPVAPYGGGFDNPGHGDRYGDDFGGYGGRHGGDR